MKRTLFWLLMLVVLVLLFGWWDAEAQTQTLQRRSEPHLQEESCRDHLTRLRWEMWATSMQHAKVAPDHGDFFLKRADNVLLAKDFNPSMRTCTKQFLKTADLLAASWAWKLVEAEER